MLSVEGIHTYYGHIHALKGISLEVKEKEIVCLIGSNGAGKSTTLMTVNGILHPSEGRILFLGQDITTLPADKIAGELGDPRLVNTILIGVLSNYLPIPVELWQEVEWCFMMLSACLVLLCSSEIARVEVVRK